MSEVRATLGALVGGVAIGTVTWLATVLLDREPIPGGYPGHLVFGLVAIIAALALSEASPATADRRSPVRRQRRRRRSR